jgi:hypothetical protein
MHVLDNELRSQWTMRGQNTKLVAILKCKERAEWKRITEKAKTHIGL